MRIPYVAKFIIVAALIISTAELQYYFDIQKKQRGRLAPFILPAQAIKMADLGLHSAAAAALWIYAIQQTTEFPAEIPGLIKNVNEVDPKFSYPYAFASVVLPSFGKIQEAVAIGQVGIKNSDPDWRIPYYLATTYHTYLKDRKNAAFYFALAANTPGAFEGAKVVASRYGTRSTAIEQTKDIWTSIYESSDDEIVKDRARKYIIHIELMETLQKAISIYRQRHGISPKKIEDLVSGKIIREVPQSPLGVEFYLDERGGIQVR